MYSIFAERFSTTWNLTTERILQVVTILEPNLKTKEVSELLAVCLPSPYGGFETPSIALQTLQITDKLLVIIKH